nr:MAG: replication associated protein [Arizlama virus]
MTTNPIHTWDFTLKYEKHEGFQMEVAKFLEEHCKSWVFQLERGEGGFLHYQGRVSLKNKSRKGPPFPNIHWSPTCNTNKSNSFYVTKEDTRVDGPWKDTDPYIPRQCRDIELYPWQKAILADARVWDKRHINIVICLEGNIGKSTLCTWAECRGLATCIPMMDSYKDYMRMAYSAPACKLYFIDFPRSMNKNNCHGFWSAVECLKNGKLFDDRYIWKQKYIDCPNIWIFTNEFPNTEFLSGDRWKFWKVSQDNLYPYDL